MKFLLIHRANDMLRRVVLVGILVSVIGCASPPPHSPPEVRVEAPASWATPGSPPGSPAVATTAGPEDWWLGLGVPAVDSAVTEALSNNLDLVVAVARVDQAAALARAAGADLWPQVNAGATASRRRQNLIGIPIPGSGGVIATRSNAFGVSLDVAWEVDLWGRVRTAQAAALSDLQASWADLAALRLSIAAQTVKAYFAALEARLQVELAEKTEASFRLSAEQVRARYEEGVRTSLELRLALANHYGAEALLEARRQVLDRAVRQLELLLGRYPAGMLVPEGDLPSVPGAIPAGLPSELLVRRPDLLAAERRYAAAERRVSQARRAFFPRISLTSSAGTLSNSLEDLVDLDFGVWSIAAGLTQPIFQGGRLRANLAQSHATSDQALAQYALGLLRAFGEVESGLYAEEVLARREDRTAAASEQSVAAQSLAERQYEAGIVDYITVLETQRRALTAQSELLSVRRERLDARVNLHLALGGGFDLDEEWIHFLEQQTDNQTEGTDGE